jgi:hypothetical protein
MAITKKPVGICPACGEAVPWDDPDGPVWTCPADLSRRNPYWEPAHEGITEELCEQSGVYSNCAEDFDGLFCCYERLPLHGVCYEKGDY